MMQLTISDFQALPDSKVKLKKWPTNIEPLYSSKKNYQKLLQKNVAALSELQHKLYADNRYAVLLIFQGMDAAGKDGAIRHVMSGINPQGFQVFSFKQPSENELDHDFLWRTARCLPERGRIGIFNRSYYEEVLIVKVHPDILFKQRLADNLPPNKAFWQNRYRSIVEHEAHLHRSGTRIIKFFLHQSKDEQARRFMQRIDDPDKNWKLTTADVEQREFWDDYSKAYEDCINATTSKESPWYIVPADDKQNARLIISEIFLKTLGDLPLAYPQATDAHRLELQSIRDYLEKS
ncbi:ADP-polyphosphate phosphotransferase [Methylophaga sp.]|uniref:ADP-polyphosphate phosphotransferase n=1 Tax=Methylophaga sp. TaxID=2024840 RepID=UPI00272052CB|nr:ADP-polyphosphate phosphotransferase [Methylophaga sp.]MDO8826660.1 polyphosphate kinase 2 family protein [Methylophaga sp.]